MSGPAMNGFVPDARKIAVLRANAVGDYLFCVPALESIKAAYPHAELVLLGDEWHERELSGRPGPVDRVIAVPPLPGLREPHPFLDRMRAESFDIVLQMHGGGRHSNPVVKALGACLTAGLRTPDAVGLDRELPYIFFQPEIFRYLEVAELIGAAPVTYRPRFAVTPDDLRLAEEVAGARYERLRVALHPGATDPRRRWPPERFAAVADALPEADILITGSTAEAGLAEQVERAAQRPVRSLAGAFTLGGLAGLYSTCDLVIANDTGPLHLAAAVGTATVGIYWIGNMLNCAPADRGRHRQLISWTLNCPQCGQPCLVDLYPRRFAGEPCPHRVCFVSDVPLEEVLEAATECLSGGVAMRRFPARAAG